MRASWIVCLSCVVGCAGDVDDEQLDRVEAAAITQPPSITSFSPSSATQTTAITINGKNFVEPLVVKFNGTPATMVVLTGSTKLTAIVPTGATTGTISVTTSLGTATSNGTFKVRPLTGTLTPDRGFPGTAITISGSGFTGASGVKLGSLTMAFTVVDDATITATIPPTTLVSGKVTVTTPAGADPSDAAFVVFPELASFAPTAGIAGSSVTIAGGGFTDATAVKLGTVSMPFTVVDDATISATIPSNGSSNKLTVVTPRGNRTSTTLFTIIRKPTITSFTPASAALPVTVTIVGANFTGTTALSVGATSLTGFIVSATKITATIPLGAPSGKFTATNAAGSATSAAKFVAIDRCANVVCEAQDACHVAGVCDGLTGSCSNPIKPDGTTCSDGDACTLDSCQEGACVATAPLTCTPDSCHAAGVCDPSTGCSEGEPIECPGVDQCHVATCDAETGCGTPQPLTDTPCDDGLVSTTNDRCQAGACNGMPAIGGLAAWFKAESIAALDGDPVITWPDSSGNGNHASQPVANLRPTYRAAAYNGRPAVRFDGVGSILEAADADSLDVAQLSVFVVARTLADGRRNAIYFLKNGDHDNDHGAYSMLQFRNTNNGPYRNTTFSLRHEGASWRNHESASPLVDGEFAMVEGTFDGTHVRVFKDGVLENTYFDPGAIVATTGSFEIGGYTHSFAGPSNVELLDGEIAEIIVFDSALDDTNRIAVENYLRLKYAPAFASCRDILVAGQSHGDGVYLLEAAGSRFAAYCDMTTDGGGWTLGVNIASDLGPIDLAAYQHRTATPLSGDYGIGLLAFERSTLTQYRLGCVEATNGSPRTMFVTGLDPEEPIFQAAGTITKTLVACSLSSEMTDPLFGDACVANVFSAQDDDNHTYYGNPQWDVAWALYAEAEAYTLRHCAADGPGVFNAGTLWFR